MPTIVVDAMGGDFAPEEVVKGVASVSLETSIQCVLVGDEKKVQSELDRCAYNPEQISVLHAPETIGMDEDPKEAVEKKKQASLLVAARTVADSRGDALVTAGNTGALVLACSRFFRTIRGIRKTALASVFPRQTEYPGQDPLALLLDVGATVRCDAVELVQFALMGEVYARRISKTASPRVALLNMGKEENKGGEVLVRAYRMLRSLSGINFIGNIEGDDLAKGKADVIVCEGLLGNVVLKLLEGISEIVVDLASLASRERWRWKLGLMMLAGGIGRLRDLTDYASYGGAPILGFEKVVIKAHGRSTARAIGNAVKVAAKAVRDRVPEEIAAGIAQLL
ncbi:MAG: phosphate acyltransferase [Candidatus Binatia bacterium]|nr:MAG: phosphate acyltransferase [Candidatus Binatia bacterium]